MSKKKRNRQKRMKSVKKASKNNTQNRGLKQSIIKWILERIRGAINGIVEDAIKWFITLIISVTIAYLKSR